MVQSNESIIIRHSESRGKIKMDWLEGRYSFSFYMYHDPDWESFRTIRVINEDVIQAGKGFDFHPHRNMEIVSYIISGALEHKDNMGNSARIYPGEIQKMSAGKGVIHSEYNPLPDEETHMLQIWIEPSETGLEPSYEQKSFKEFIQDNALILLASGSKSSDSSVSIHQDVDLYRGTISAGNEIIHNFEQGRGGWLQLINGGLKINDHEMRAGDGAMIDGTEIIIIRGLIDSEFLLFDLM